jgi:predicted PurR-regulated permease PerM
LKRGRSHRRQQLVECVSPHRMRRSDSMMLSMSATSDSDGPVWPLPRGLLILIGAGAAVLTVAGLRSAASIIAPTFFAIVITVAVHPLRVMVARRGWPDWAGIVVGIVAAYAVVIGLIGAVIYSIAKFATLLPQYAGDLDDRVSSATSKLSDLGIGESQIKSISGSFDTGKLVDVVTEVLQSFLGLASNLLFLILLLLFLAMDAGNFPQKLSTNRVERGAAVSALESFAHGTRQYLIVSTVFGFIVAVFDVAFLYFTPVPEPLLWGLLAFITNYIPNIGFIIGLAPPAVLGLLEGGPGLMILIIVVYCVLNFIIQSVIQPKFVGDAVGLSVSLTFLSLVFWAWVLGPAGAFLAVPLSLLAKALLVDVDRDSLWLKPLLAGGATSADEAGGETTPSDGRTGTLPRSSGR